MAKKAMGKGLGSILGDDDDSDYISMQAPISEENRSFRLISLDRIDPNPDQPRKDFDKEALNELVSSIKRNGVLQPILVEKKSLNRFLLIAGERRYRASTIAGLKDIPAVIKDDLSEEEVLEFALIENIQRENLSPIEEALAYRNLMKVSSLTQEEIADKVGKKRSTITNSLRLLKLPEEMRNATNKGRLTLGHAKTLLSVISSTNQNLLFKKIINEGISVRESERLANEYNSGRSNSKIESNRDQNLITERPSAEIIHIQDELMTCLGTKILVKGSLEKGKIEINYYSLDDLKRIYDIVLRK